MDVNDRLKSLLNKSFRTQSEFAELLDIPQNTLSQYLNSRRKIPTSVLVKICERLYVSIVWLTTGEGPSFMNPGNAQALNEKLLEFKQDPANYLPPDAEPASGTSNVRLPVIPDIAAGNPSEVSEEPAGHITLSRSLLNLDPPYYCFLVKGDSMQPEVRPDDLVVVSANWEGVNLDGRICAFRTPDGLLLKRLLLSPDGDGGWLYSINAVHHKPIRYGRDDTSLFLIGVMILNVRQYVRPV